MRIFTAAASDTYTWYQLWEAGSALFSVCTRHQKGGSVRGLGAYNEISETVTFEIN